MRDPSCCTVLVLLLCLSAPGNSQGPQVLGKIVSSSATSLGGVAAPSGSTVLSGDTLSTSADGTALVRFTAASQVELSENTSVSFSGTPAHVRLKIAQGTVGAMQSDPDSLLIETSQCTLQPAKAGNASYSVSVLPGTSAKVIALNGTVLAAESDSGHAFIISEGETSACPNAAAFAPRVSPPSSSPGPREEVKPAPSVPAGQASPSPEAPKHSNTSLWLLLLGGGAAAGIGAAVAAGGHGGGGGGPASPSTP
jgi:hypothetical protein